MKNSRNLRIYLRDKIQNNFVLTENKYIKFKNNSTIKSIKDKIRRFIKKKVEVLEHFVDGIEQRREYLKYLSCVRDCRQFINNTSISGLEISEIPDIYFYSIKEDYKNFAFDIRDLYQIIIEGKENPYTRNPFDYWVKTHILCEVEKRNIYPECFWYSIFGDLIDNISINDLFNSYCCFRENNDDFIYYTGNNHNNLVLAFYGNKEKDFKCTLAIICQILPETQKKKFIQSIANVF
jgi:hypothetical protein